MFDGPFDSEVQGPFREIAHDHFQCANVNLRFVFRVHGVEVWWCMFAPEHLDDDAEELADGGHTLYSDARKGTRLVFPFFHAKPFVIVLEELFGEIGDSQTHQGGNHPACEPHLPHQLGLGLAHVSTDCGSVGLGGERRVHDFGKGFLLDFHHRYRRFARCSAFSSRSTKLNVSKLIALIVRRSIWHFSRQA